MTNPFSFKPEISLGQIITIATMLVGLAMAWQALTSRVDAVAKNDAAQDAKLEALTNTVGDIRQLQAEQGVDIRYIRAFVEDERRASRQAASLP